MEAPPPSYESLMKDSKEGYQPNIIPDREVIEPSAPALTALPVPPRLTYWDDFKRNQPQRNSMNAAYFIFMSAGMSIAFSFSYSSRPYDFGYISSMIHGNFIIRMCWFMCAIIGGLIGLIVVKKFTKRKNYFLAAVLVLVNGICFACAPGDYLLLTLGRCCDGLAFGITLPAFIVAASEESDKRFRGSILGFEHVCITIGMLTQVVCSFAADTDISVNLAHGVLVLIYAFGSFISNFIWTIESPVYHLQKDNETEAINVLKMLRKPLDDFDEVPDLLAEYNQLLEEDPTRGVTTNLKTSLKFVVLYVLTTIFFSVPRYRNSMTLLFDVRHFMMSRLAGAVIGCYALDTLGRRLLTTYSLLTSGILLFVGIGQSEIVTMFFQFFAGIVATCSICYLGEAVSVSVKPYFVVVSLCLGCLVQIIQFAILGAKLNYAYGILSGVIQTLFAIYFIVSTHETKGTSLRGALVELSKPAVYTLPYKS